MLGEVVALSSRQRLNPRHLPVMVKPESSAGDVTAAMMAMPWILWAQWFRYCSDASASVAGKLLYR